MRRWIAIPLLLAIMGILLKPLMCLQTCLEHTTMQEAAQRVAVQQAHPQIKMSCHGTPMPSTPDFLPTTTRHPELKTSCGMFNIEVIPTAAQRVFALPPVMASIIEPVPDSQVQVIESVSTAIHVPASLQILRI